MEQGWLEGHRMEEGQTANTLEGDGLNLVTEGRGGGREAPRALSGWGETGGKKRVLAEMGYRSAWDLEAARETLKRGTR